MPSDLIYREDAKDYARHAMAKRLNVLEYLDEVPAVYFRPVVHGHWVYEEPNGANSFKGAYWCDQCHQPESYRKNFCPNCGADMREVITNGN